MQFENQNAVVSWMPRITAVVLAVIGATVSAPALLTGGLLFAVFVVAILIPWLTLTIWAAWRSQPVETVSINVADSEVLVCQHGRETSVPFSEIASVTLLRGLAWVERRPLVGRTYVLALYDDQLRRFVAELQEAGVRVNYPGGYVTRDSSGSGEAPAA